MAIPTSNNLIERATYGWDDTNSQWSAQTVGSEGETLVKDYIQSIIDDGRMYSVFYKQSAVGSGSTAQMLIRSSVSEELHCIVEVAAEDRCTLIVNENPTISANGTSLTAYNKNRNSASTPLSTLFHTPTISGLGTTIDQTFMPNGGNRIIGGDFGQFQFILDPGDDYLFRLTNNISSTQDLGITVHFYTVSV